MLGPNANKVLAAPVTAVFCADLGEGFICCLILSTDVHYFPSLSPEFLFYILLCDHDGKLMNIYAAWSNDRSAFDLPLVICVL